MNYPLVYDRKETNFDKNGLAVLINAKNVAVREVINGEFTLSFILPRNDPNWQYIRPENFIKVYDASQKKDQLFRIRGLDEQRDKDGKITSNIQCEHVYYDAQDCAYFPTVEIIGDSPENILNYAFAGTKFTVGTVEITTLTDIFLDRANPAQIVSQLIENVGGELIKDNYTVNLVAKRGQSTGVQLRIGKNIESFKKTTDSKNVVTRLYPYGADGMEISSVNDGKAYIDSPLITDYDNPKIGNMDYKDIDNPQMLLYKSSQEWSCAEYDGIDRPKVTYSGNFLELKKLKEYGDYEAFGLGDTAKVIDEGLETDTLQRIVDYECYPYEVQKSKVILANYKVKVYKQSSTGGMLSGLVGSKKTVDKVTTKDGKLNPSWFQNIKSKLQTFINGGLKNAVMHNTGDIWVDDEKNPTMAMGIIAGGFAVANSKTESGDWDWRTIGTADRFIADEVDAKWIYAGSVSANQIRGQMGYIVDLTVDQLDTSDKVQRYLISDTTAVNYIKEYDQTIQFITANTDGTQTEQLKNRDNEPLYWNDNTHTGITTEVTDYPVTIYKYTELVKGQITFERNLETQAYEPKIILGAGTGTGSNGKAVVWKDGEGLLLSYTKSTGEEVYIRLGENGIEGIGRTGAALIWVQDDTPTTAQDNDLWVDTDDYTRYDTLSISAARTLTVDDPEVIFANGTFNITLHSTSVPGILKKIYNTGSGTIILIGTINGQSNMTLSAGQSVELITDGSGWRH
ncbi:MAG: phage tail protein [Bacillota bacterium]|nr:phage tail protein [Bacillota bacterium]